MNVASAVRALFDRVAIPFKAAPPRTSLFTEQAVDQFLSFLTGVADPDEVLAKAGITRARLRALTGDDEITAAMDTRREALLAVPWRLEVDGISDDENYPEPVQWLWEQLETRCEQVLRSCIEALPYGYSVQEAVYVAGPDGRITWGEITEKPFEWFIPKLDGTVLYRSRNNPQGEPTDPRKFFLTVRNQTYRNPYGEALFSRLWWPWFFRQQGWRFWVRWLERFGTPLLVGKAAGDAQVMANRLAAIANSAVVAVGAQDVVEIAENHGGAGHFEGFERAICGRIQKVILGQTLTSDAGGSSGKSGSYALGQVHNDVRQDRRDADVRLVVKTVQRMVSVLWELNGFPGETPRFVMADDTGLELDRADRDAKLVQAGVVKFTPDYLLRVYDFEPEDLDIEAMTAPPPPAAAPAPAAGPAPKPAKAIAALLSASPRFTPEQQVIERGVAEALTSLEGAIADAEIKACIRAATSADDLIARLSALLRDMDATEFERVVERALFAADIIGYAHASQR